MSKLTILEPKNLDEAMRFAEMLSKSGMVPSAFQGKPANVLVAIQWGYELSLAPMQALQMPQAQSQVQAKSSLLNLMHSLTMMLLLGLRRLTPLRLKEPYSLLLHPNQRISPPALLLAVIFRLFKTWSPLVRTNLLPRCTPEKQCKL